MGNSGLTHLRHLRTGRSDGEPRITRVYATIRVEHPGQKAIVIGSQGAMLKRIGTLAPHEMERLFGMRIYLDRNVRVEPGWRTRRHFLDALDWRTIDPSRDR